MAFLCRKFPKAQVIVDAYIAVSGRPVANVSYVQWSGPFGVKVPLSHPCWPASRKHAMTMP